MNVALLLSGGKGTRINSDLPKQYVRSGGRMMITYSLFTVLSSKYTDLVVIVADPSEHGAVMEDIRGTDADEKKIVGFAEPGTTRQLSILNGLRYASGSCDISPEDTVMVYDAARPFVSNDLIERCYMALPGFDGVMPVLPMKDTVYMSDDGKHITKLLDRSRIHAGQAPELFLFEKYLKANESLSPEEMAGINGATEPAVLGGMEIIMIPGDERNIKITTDRDMEEFRKRICDMDSESRRCL